MEEWTFETLFYEIQYFGDDQRMETWIAETALRLPSEVVDFVLERCRFLSIGRAALGIVWPARIATHFPSRRTRNMWFILLEENLPGDDAHGIIAHEIAHAWLKHDRMALDVAEDVEIQAANLTEGWGFTGMGADPTPSDR